ncbi:MAG: class I SAM-dependent methyltransferase [Candidatus Woesearchaeota archaeon]
MVLCAIVEKKNAPNVLAYIKEHDISDSKFRVFSDEQFLFIPVKNVFSHPDTHFEEKSDEEFAKKIKIQSLKELIEQELPQAKGVKTSFEIIGTIAILEIDEQYRTFEQKIAQLLLDAHAHVRTVVRKDGPHQGPYRIQQVRHLAGEKTTQTIHVENGVRLEMDIQKTYFSPRMASERERLCAQIAQGQWVLDMFCGVGSLVVQAAKLGANVTGIEINPDAVSFAKQNLKKNHVRADILQGDAQTIALTVKQSFDHIIMNHPKASWEFLESANTHFQKNTILHFYCFAKENEFEQSAKDLQDFFSKKNKQTKLLGIHTCGTQGVRIHRICIDIECL